MRFDTNRFFMAWFLTMAFFQLYAATHAHPGALFEGLQSLVLFGLVAVVDYYEKLNGANMKP